MYVLHNLLAHDESIGIFHAGQTDSSKTVTDTSQTSCKGDVVHDVRDWRVPREQSNLMHMQDVGSYVVGQWPC